VLLLFCGLAIVMECELADLRKQHYKEKYVGMHRYTS